MSKSENGDEPVDADEIDTSRLEQTEEEKLCEKGKCVNSRLGITQDIPIIILTGHLQVQVRDSNAAFTFLRFQTLFGRNANKADDAKDHGNCYRQHERSVVVRKKDCMRMKLWISLPTQTHIKNVLPM